MFYAHGNSYIVSHCAAGLLHEELAIVFLDAVGISSISAPNLPGFATREVSGRGRGGTQLFPLTAPLGR